MYVHKQFLPVYVSEQTPCQKLKDIRKTVRVFFFLVHTQVYIQYLLIDPRHAYPQCTCTERCIYVNAIF